MVLAWILIAAGILFLGLFVVVFAKGENRDQLSQRRHIEGCSKVDCDHPKYGGH